MTVPVIIDLFAAAILVGFMIYGACRGLFRAFAGLLAVVVALMGAGMIANALSKPAVKVVMPLVQAHIENKLDAAVTAQAPEIQMPEEAVEEGTFSIEDLLAMMGLDSDVRASLAEQAHEKVQETGASLAMAVVESIAQSFIYAALYILSFIVLLLLLKLVLRALDLVFRLPGLHLLNALGGGVIGLAEGALLLFLSIWLLRRFGVSFDTETVGATYVLRFFTTNTPLSALAFLK